METKAVSLTSAALWLCLHATNCLMEKEREKKPFWQITHSMSVHLLKTHNNNKGSKGMGKC